MVIGQGYGVGIGGCNRLCSTTIGHSLVALFSLSVSIENRPLLWMVVRSQTYYPKHILAYGNVAPGFKNKTRYTPYVSPGSQISHIATNKGDIK
jgi:hypothetical protein